MVCIVSRGGQYFTSGLVISAEIFMVTHLRVVSANLVLAEKLALNSDSKGSRNSERKFLTAFLAFFCFEIVLFLWRQVGRIFGFVMEFIFCFVGVIVLIYTIGDALIWCINQF
ncbi:hypothetical protein AC624_08460 [Bacillus sp. FJAT-27238]|nr:hypothetical protein AC624_08460 [Bacillus sp. FJAT-27238]